MKELLMREAAIASESIITAVPFSEVREEIGFPEQLDGKVIIDICAGASSCTMKLRKMGAQAYAVDFGFADKKGFKKATDRSLTDFAHYERSVATFNLDPSLIAKLGGARQAFKDNTRADRKIRDQVIFDMEKNGYYIAAAATHLPFGDNTVDFCFSREGITGILVNDRDLLVAAVMEAYRVLKPGGELQLHSWLGDPPNYYWPESHLESARHLKYTLLKNKVSFREEEAISGLRLTVVKS